MVPCCSTTIGRGLVPSRAYDGSEYHISYADFLAERGCVGKCEIGELKSQAVIGRYGRQDFAYEPGIKRLFLYRSFRVSPSLPHSKPWSTSPTMPVSYCFSCFHSPEFNPLLQLVISTGTTQRPMRLRSTTTVT